MARKKRDPQKTALVCRKESNIFDDNLIISLEYTLSDEEYKVEKDGVFERYFSEAIDGQQKMYYIYPKGKLLDGGLEMMLVCNEENNQLIYGVSMGK
ncbi:hypothetical protein [Konateibacter massiliensis]|uniref:hypothetical protein n=1 Tax=Konateibacter massiliensis TaxID=2002841 RepID=UPI000C14C25E|nr:hypothetical protein [Konateibacter massiliensis]